MLLQTQARRHLKNPGPYLAAALSLTGLIPVILWNANHQWATFTFNLASRHAPPAFGIRHAVDYLAGQAIALSPVVLILAVPVMTGSILHVRSGNRKAWLLPAFLSAVPLLGFFVLSFFTKVGLHWPGVGAPFLATALCASQGRAGIRPRRLHLSIASAWAVTFFVFMLPLLAFLLPTQWEYPLRPDKINSEQIRKYTAGTREIGETVSHALDSMPDNTGLFTFTRSYALSSLVAFYTPGHPEVTVLGGGSAHGRNHTFWFEPEKHAGENAVFVTYSPVSKEKEFIRQRFRSWEAVTDSGGEGGGVVSVIKCYGYNGMR
jgi:hypothetical protein